MAKANTFTKRKRSLQDSPKLRLKKNAKVTKHHPFRTLLDEKVVSRAFWKCLNEHDPEGALEMITAYLNALTKHI